MDFAVDRANAGVADDVADSANSGLATWSSWVNSPAWGNGYDLGRYQFGDFNGDGKTDLMFIGSAADVHIRAATGSTFAPDQPCGGFGDGAPSRYQLADFNGHGRLDLLFIAGDGRLYIRVANGMSFGGEYSPFPFGNGNDLLRYFVMDFTGDGKADVLFVGGEQPEANLTLAQTVAGDPVLTKVENGIGGTITVAYAQAADVPGVIVPPAWDAVTGAPAGGRRTWRCGCS